MANVEDKVERRDIEISRAHGALRTVTKGLTPQDRVIANGLMMLRPGLKVQVQGEKAEPRNPKSEAGAEKPATEEQPKPASKPQT